MCEKGEMCNISKNKNKTTRIIIIVDQKDLKKGQYLQCLDSRNISIKNPQIKESRIQIFYFFSSCVLGVISCKISCEVFNKPKLERSIGGTSNRKKRKHEIYRVSFFARFSDRLHRHTFLVFVLLS